MRWLIVLAVLVVAIGGLAVSLADEPPKNQVKVYLTTDLRGDPTREVVMQTITMPPGADNGFHIHHGDDFLLVQEGEILNTTAGQQRVLKAGDSIHIDPEVVHRNQNVSDQPARSVEIFIIEKGKPRFEPVK